MNRNILTVKNLSVAYNSLEVVSDVTFSIEEGKTFCLVGESGSGKSTIAMSILKLLPLLSTIKGTILINDNPVYQLDNKRLQEIRRRQVSVVFQDPVGSLIPNIPIGKQLGRVIAYRLHIDDKRKIINEMNNALLQVELTDTDRIRKSYPHQLSGGMCQRVIIAMALCVEPILVIADEPTSSVDSLTQHKILKLLKNLQKNLNFALLFITHDMRIASHYSDYIGVMKEGRLLEVKDTKSFFTKPDNEYSKKLIESAKMLSI